jgi:arylmalonate decarboxylase
MNAHSRREFFKIAAAGAAGAALAGAAAEPVLGMIFPPLNYPVPPEATALYPHGVKFLAEGLGLERMTPEGYDKVVPKIVPAAQTLARRGATGLPATSMSNGIVDGVRAAGGKRLAVATAYNEDVTNRLKIFLEESGFEVVHVKGMGIERFQDRPPVTHDELLNFSAGVFEAAPKADTLVISCGALRTLELLVPLEERCKVPVVSSTPHALWNAVRLVGLTGHADGFGSVLAKS